jgi:hypothetical protein
MRVQRVIVGPPIVELELGWDGRAAMERQLREWQAGHPPFLGTCSFGAFVPRFVEGGSYVLFMNEREGGLNDWGILRVEGNDIVFDDDGLRSANNGALYMERDTFDRYFTGIASNEDHTFITADRMPLAILVRAIAGLRGDPSIAPPDTGNAGLKDR